MGPFVLSSHIDLGKFPYVRSAMYRGAIPSVHDHRNNGTEILQGRCCIFFRNNFKEINQCSGIYHV